MACDRRSFLGALAMTGMLSGCARGAVPAVAPGLLGDRFLSADGRVIDTGNGGISHSEGQGYGLLAAEAAGDRALFDRIWRWTDTTLARPDVRLFAWRFDPRATPPVADRNDASDGDILIAWALFRAAKRWTDQGYADASAAIRAAIRDRLIRRQGGMTLLLPGLEGFVTPQAVTINPSYYIWPALQAFRALDGDGAWGALITDGRKLLTAASFGPRHLPTDWVDVGADGTVAPARGRAPLFGFDAIRVPLYLAWGRQRDMLANFRHAWGTYRAANQPIPAWINVVTDEVAPYPLSAGGRAVAGLILDDTALMTPPVDTGDYYSTALADLVRLARQGR